MVNKTITKLSLIVLLVSSISYSIEAQEFDFEQTDAVSLIEETLAVDTLVADTAYSDYKYGYRPSLAQLAIDSLKSLPNRVHISDSILDNDTVRMLITNIIVNKVKLVDNIMDMEGTKEDFTNLGLPDILYDYFLQDIGDFNFRNKVEGKSAEEIQKDFKEIQDKARRELEEVCLQKRRQDLFDHNVELFDYFEEKENNGDLNSVETENLRSIYDLVSNKLQLVDGKLTVDIPENKELDDFSKKCIQYMQFIIELTNIDLDITESTIEEREGMKEWLKNDMKDYARTIEERQKNKNE